MQQDVQILKQKYNAAMIALHVCPIYPRQSFVIVTHTLKLHAKTCYIVDNSAVDYSISLTFCMEFKRMTPKMP